MKNKSINEMFILQKHHCQNVSLVWRDILWTIKTQLLLQDFNEDFIIEYRIYRPLIMLYYFRNSSVKIVQVLKI